MRSAAVVLIALGAGLAGCGDSPDRGSPGDPRPPRTNGQGLEAELILKPATAEPGDTIGVVVENTGEVRILYGLGNRVQRRVDGSWEDANEDVYGERAFFPQVGLIVGPGERAGPDYSQVSDQIPLPDDLEPGVYRVRKRVSAHEGSGTATVEATFTVRDPAAGQNR